MVKVQSSLAKRLICRVGSTTIPSGYASLGVAASSARSQRRDCRVIGAVGSTPPKADVRRANRYVGFGPKADIAHSFDHLVGELLEM